MPSNIKISFAQFLKRFPKVELPVTLSEDNQIDFSRHNDPLPQPMVDKFLVGPTDPIPDEFTEYVPCFRLPPTDIFQGVVYWRGALMDYQYILVTFDKRGAVIDQGVLSGTKVIENSLLRSVATINEEMIIYVMAGVADTTTNKFDPTSNKSFHLEITPSGEIISTD